MQAANILLNRWPPQTSPKSRKSHLEARQAVLKALESWRDRATVREARDAFEKAARDAGIAN